MQKKRKFIQSRPKKIPNQSLQTSNSHAPMVTETSPFFRPLTGLIIDAGRWKKEKYRRNYVNLTIPAPKKNAKPANKVRSKQLLYLFWHFCRSRRWPRLNKVKDKKMKSAQVLPDIDQEDEETIKLLKVWGLYILATRRTTKCLLVFD